jgi:hypothetical protein
MSARRVSTAVLNARIAAVFGAVSLATACSTTGATFRSGVGDAFPERAPYYAGKPVTADGVTIGVVPITFQQAANGTASFDPKSSAGSAVAALVAT